MRLLIESANHTSIIFRPLIAVELCFKVFLRSYLHEDIGIHSQMINVIIVLVVRTFSPLGIHVSIIQASTMSPMCNTYLSLSPTHFHLSAITCIDSSLLMKTAISRTNLIPLINAHN